MLKIRFPNDLVRVLHIMRISMVLPILNKNFSSSKLGIDQQIYSLFMDRPDIQYGRITRLFLCIKYSLAIKYSMNVFFLHLLSPLFLFFARFRVSGLQNCLSTRYLVDLTRSNALHRSNKHVLKVVYASVIQR